MVKKFSDLSELCASVVNTSSFLAANMHGEPNCFCICLLNSMLHMARNRHMIALFHPHKLSPLELQSGFPAHYDDPLVLILIVPKTRRAAVRLRDDALDCNTWVLKQDRKLLLIGKLGKVMKDIFHLNGHIRPVQQATIRRNETVLETADGGNHLLPHFIDGRDLVHSSQG